MNFMVAPKKAGMSNPLILSPGLPTPTLGKQQSFFSLRMNYETQVTKIEMAIKSKDSKKLTEALSVFQSKTQKLVDEFQASKDDEDQIALMKTNLQKTVQ